VGSRMSKLLARAFPSMEALREASLEELRGVEQIGPEIARGVYEWFRRPENARLVEKLRRAGVRMREEAPPRAARGPLAGKKVVLTGELESMSREEATRQAEAAGARVTSNVSRGTSFVVVGANPGSKYDKARALGVETLDEPEFLRRLGH
jgi:DNA ligase (NAD+)